jgi:activator of HSP90 ATPase
MPSTIEQTVWLPVSPDELFDAYLDPARHAAITGHAVSIGSAPGAPFRAFGDQLSGRMLLIVPKRLVVQSWRSSHWRDDDLDSILILRFSPDAAGGRIDLVHANVADHDHAGVSEGWEKFYWTPWRAYLAGGA